MKKKPIKSAAQQLRIIGGEWRGRKLAFTPEEGLRPTLDRYRETLFNWLMYEIEGTDCLDLFAGSGALGLEALSRGARSATFIERSKPAANQIKQHLSTLKCDRGQVVCTEANQWLTQSDQSYDVVFLDPPFHKDFLKDILNRLFSNSYINDHGYIYIEAESNFHLPTLPANWSLNREKKTKNKVFFLLQKASHI